VKNLTRIIGVIQARTSSKRLPKKVLLEINNHPVVKWQIERVKRVGLLDELVLATTTHQEDEPLVSIARECQIKVLRGEENDVLSRFYKVIDLYKPDVIVRITADCPLFMPDLCDSMLRYYLSQPCDYLSNTLVPTWPDGCDVEIVSKESFDKLKKLQLTSEEKEHVTLGMYRQREMFRCFNFLNDNDESKHRWTLDCQEDYIFIKSVYELFKGRELEFTYKDVMNLFSNEILEPRIDEGEMRNSALRNL
jgi:spore coat polysaccharide biosynthesis protein SpsF